MADYTEINRPYDSNMNRVDYSVGRPSPGASFQTNTPGESGSDATMTPTPPNLPGQADNRVLPDRNFDDLWINKSIKSRGFLPHAKGFWLDGKTGNAQFNNIELVGGVIQYKKTSFNDSAHSGYFIGPEGIYFGDSGDNTFLKYDINAGTLTFVGTFQTSVSGQRVVLNHNTDTLSFLNSAGDELLSIGGTSSTGGHIFVTQTSGDTLPALRVTGSPSTATSPVLFFNASGSNSIVLTVNSGSDSQPSADIFHATSSAVVPSLRVRTLTVSGGAFYQLIDLQGLTEIHTGFGPPGTYVAPKGSLLVNQDGNLYISQGAGVWKTVTAV